MKIYCKKRIIFHTLPPYSLVRSKFSSQPQHNPLTIHEVEVQDGDLPNMLEEESMMTLDDNKQTK